MIISTASWGWPQWVMLIALFLGFAIQAAQHGKPRLDTSNKLAPEPEKYSGFAGLARMMLWLFILGAGGFFS
jgi:hypothetical protein